MDNILIPVCQHEHWFLLVIDVKRRMLEVLDSVHNQARRDAYEQHLRQFLLLRADFVPDDLSATGWTMSDRRSNQQRGGNDCGVFVLMVSVINNSVINAVNLVIQEANKSI